jgi:type VI protein secretion system component VasF
MSSTVFSTAKMLESFFKDFFYELLKCKEIALRTIRLDNELDNALPNAAALDKQNAENQAAGDVANQNQHALEMHDMLSSGVPVHAVKALEEIQQRLKSVLNAQSLKIASLFTDDLSSFKESQYAMVALADEVFLNLNWKGRIAWQNTLLEG